MEGAGLLGTELWHWLIFLSFFSIYLLFFGEEGAGALEMRVLPWDAEQNKGQRDTAGAPGMI